jgi:hypothetical protein
MGTLMLPYTGEEEAYQQPRLRYRLAAAAADLYLQAGFTLVYQDNYCRL